MPGTRHRSNLPRRTPAQAPQPGRATRSLNQFIRIARSHPRRSGGAGLLLLVAIADITYLIWPTPYRGYQPAVRTRTYTSYTACLLTDPTGITGPTAAPVWAGM